MHNPVKFAISYKTIKKHSNLCDIIRKDDKKILTKIKTLKVEMIDGYVKTLLRCQELLTANFLPQ